jgi:acyl-coenzyme A thioesterase PaaI-like protein
VSPTSDAERTIGADRIRLADSTRALIEAVAAANGTGDADGATLAAAADAVDAVTASLREGTTPASATRSRPNRSFGNFLPRSLLVGRAHPISPAGTHTFADGVLDVRVTFGTAYEGPPGYVHGGIIALAFDELFGMVTVLNGQGSLTGRLSIRYRKPTPLGRELRMTAWIDHHEGRRMRTRGTIHADDVLTVDAEGLFVAITPETVREYFGDG